MGEIGHRPIGYLDANGTFQELTWKSNNSVVYFDELNEKISAYARKCAKRKKPKMFNELQVEKIKLLRNQGASLRCIAREMGCAESTVRNYLKK